MALATGYAIGSVVIVSLISLIGIITLSWQERFLQRCLFVLVSLAVGALFGDAIIHLIPEALSGFDKSESAALWVLGGVLLFFSIEKFLHWHHHHSTHGAFEMGGTPTHAAHKNPLGALIFTADGLHNLIDGIIIGASYLISIEVGVATTLAVILHEIPQEIGDFAILLHAGYSKAYALFINFSSALLAIVGVLIVFTLESASEQFLPAMTALAAGSFLYIAGSDLVPELHKVTRFQESLIQFTAIVLGIALMWALVFLE
ncbi:MAG TPA: ZIP family metal transporter [Candidatus Paceibacterota bacterium]|jgi:zinc and cadmium transporter